MMLLSCRFLSSAIHGQNTPKTSDTSQCKEKHDKYAKERYWSNVLLPRATAWNARRGAPRRFTSWCAAAGSGTPPIDPPSNRFIMTLSTCSRTTPLPKVRIVIFIRLNEGYESPIGRGHSTVTSVRILTCLQRILKIWLCSPDLHMIRILLMQGTRRHSLSIVVIKIFYIRIYRCLKSNFWVLITSAPRRSL